MALTYDLTGIEGFKDKCYVGSVEEGTNRLHPVTEAIVFYMRLVNVGSHLTECLVPEFLARVRFLDQLEGKPLLVAPDPETGNLKEQPLTREQVQEHLGLKVNVKSVSWERFVTQKADSFRREHRGQKETSTSVPVRGG